MNLLWDHELGIFHVPPTAEGMFPSSFPNLRLDPCLPLAQALASTDPGGMWSRCRALGMRPRGVLQVKERNTTLGSCSWKHHFFLSGLVLFPLRYTLCTVQRRALLIHTDIGLHNCLLDFHFSSLPVWLITSLLTLKPLVCPKWMDLLHSFVLVCERYPCCSIVA